MVGVAIWGWALIGLVVGLLLLGVVALWRRMQSIAKEEIAFGNSQRWWIRFFKTPQIIRCSQLFMMAKLIERVVVDNLWKTI